MKCRTLKDILEKDVDKSYDLNPELCKGLVLKESTGPQYGKIEILGYVRNKKNQSRRIISPNGISPCLAAFTHGYAHGYLKDGDRIRRYTPKEFFRLMGLEDDEIQTIQETGISETQQYKMAGNSIVVDVLTEVLKKLEIT